MPDGFEVEAVQKDLRRAVRNVVAVLVRKEEQVGGAKSVDAAIADFDAREPHTLVPKDGALVEPAVLVGVFEDEDAIAQRGVPPVRVLRVSVTFRDPESAARIPRHRDGLLHIGLGGEDLALESGREFHGPGRFLGGHGAAWRLLGIEHLGKLGGSQKGEGEEPVEGGFHPAMLGAGLAAVNPVDCGGMRGQTVADPPGQR